VICKRACAPPAGLPTGNELTLARERQAKQNFVGFVVSGIVCLAWLWLLAFFATYYGS